MKKVDLRNTILPFALLEITNCIRALQPGKAIEIIGLDAGSLHDLQCIISSDRHIVTTIGGCTDCDGDIAVRIEKSGVA